jgi:hypothetical protein
MAVEGLGDPRRLDGSRNRGSVLGPERQLVDQRPELAIDAQARRRACLQVQIRSVPLVEQREESLEFSGIHEGLA